MTDDIIKKQSRELRCIRCITFKYNPLKFLDKLAKHIFDKEKWTKELEVKELWNADNISKAYKFIEEVYTKKSFMCQTVINFGGNLKRIGIPKKEVETKEYEKFVILYKSILDGQLEKKLKIGINIPEHFSLTNLCDRLNKYLETDYKMKGNSEEFADIKVLLSARASENDLTIDSDGIIKGKILKKRGKVNEYKLISCIPNNKVKIIIDKWQKLSESTKANAANKLRKYLEDVCDIKPHFLRNIGIQLAVEVRSKEIKTLGEEVKLRQDIARHSNPTVHYMNINMSKDKLLNYIDNFSVTEMKEILLDIEKMINDKLQQQ